MYATLSACFFGCNENTLEPSAVPAVEPLTTAAGDESTATPSTAASGSWETVIWDGFDGSGYSGFHNTWNYLYPWGSDHNGSARMYGSPTDHNHIYKSGSGYLVLKASRINWNEGNSSHDPWLPIRYHSGAIHAKNKVRVTDQFPEWSAQVRVATNTGPGIWPAFWLTHDGPWDAESDIMEFVGSNYCRQNTYDLAWEGQETWIATPTAYHTYKMWMRKDGNDVDLHYYIDGVWKAQHRGTNFANKDLWVILNLQMEGSSGNNGPGGDTYMHVDWVHVDRLRMW
ncbi:family 16 glycosylhydrolase [Fulvivirga sp. M361]|nr:family 16 glycosylhydrolase [Fulvivirga sp. M361]